MLLQHRGRTPRRKAPGSLFALHGALEGGVGGSSQASRASRLMAAPQLTQSSGPASGELGCSIEAEAAQGRGAPPSLQGGTGILSKQSRPQVGEWWHRLPAPAPHGTGDVGLVQPTGAMVSGQVGRDTQASQAAS